MINNNTKRILAATAFTMLASCGAFIPTNSSSGTTQGGSTTFPSGSSPTPTPGDSGSGVATCGPSPAGLYAFYRLEPLNCNLASCPAPALGARVVITDDPNYCVAKGAAAGRTVLNFPPLRVVNMIGPTAGLYNYGPSEYNGVTYARTGTFVDVQPTDWEPIADNRDIGLEQPFATNPNAPFASFTANGNTAGTDFAQAQNLTFNFDGNNVTNLSYTLKYAAQANVTDVKAQNGNIAQATLCSTLDPNVPSDATLAPEFDTSTMPYFFYNVSTGVGINANDIRYYPTGVLTDRADFCTLYKQNGGMPADARWLEIYNDGPNNGPGGFTSTGPLTMSSDLISNGAFPHFNVPGLGPLLWAGTAQITLSSDANSVTLQSFAIQPHAYAYVFPLSGGAAQNNIRCDALPVF